MLGQRRLPPQVLFLLSLLLGLLAAALAYRYAGAEKWLPAALWGGVALWLVIDAVRALGWMKNGRAVPGQPAPQPRPAPAPAATPTHREPLTNNVTANPLLRGDAQAPSPHPAKPQER